MDTVQILKIQQELAQRTLACNALLSRMESPVHRKGARRVRASGWGISTGGKPSASASSNWHVICCRGTAETAMAAMQTMMDRLKLTVNEEKTQRCRIPQEHFDFLGYTFGRCYSAKNGRAYIGTRPSTKSIRKVCRTIGEATGRRWLLKDPEERVTDLNRILVGWANYFSLGPVSKAYRAVDCYASGRLRRWLCKKHKQPGRGTARFPDKHLHDVLGLQRLSVRTRNLPWAKA